MGFVFAYILDPVIRYFTENRKFNKKIIYFDYYNKRFLLPFFLILYYLIPGIISQASALVVKLNVKGYFSKDMGMAKYYPIS